MKKKEYIKRPDVDCVFDLDNVSPISYREFTGAIPTPPKNEGEEKSYQELLNFSSYEWTEEKK